VERQVRRAGRGAERGAKLTGTAGRAAQMLIQTVPYPARVDAMRPQLTHDPLPQAHPGQSAWPGRYSEGPTFPAAPHHAYANLVTLGMAAVTLANVNAAMGSDDRWSYLTVDPLNRLVMTWQWAAEDGGTMVRIALAPDGEGTVLALTHEGFADGVQLVRVALIPPGVIEVIIGAGAAEHPAQEGYRPVAILRRSGDGIPAR
jgi:activator of Hsp90 ATPase-like protein